MSKTSRTRFVCAVCGKVTAGRIPRGSDLTFRFPRRHKVNSKDCPGNILEAKWIEVSDEKS